MYGMNTHWQFREPLTEAFRQSLEQNLVQPAAAAPGFHAYYALTLTDREVVSWQVWETQADAERFLQHVAPWIQQNVSPLLTSPPQRIAAEIAIAREK